FSSLGGITSNDIDYVQIEVWGDEIGKGDLIHYVFSNSYNGNERQKVIYFDVNNAAYGNHQFYQLISRHLNDERYILVKNTPIIDDRELTLNYNEKTGSIQQSGISPSLAASLDRSFKYIKTRFLPISDSNTGPRNVIIADTLYKMAVDSISTSISITEVTDHKLPGNNFYGSNNIRTLSRQSINFTPLNKTEESRSLQLFSVGDENLTERYFYGSYDRLFSRHVPYSLLSDLNSPISAFLLTENASKLRSFIYGSDQRIIESRISVGELGQPNNFTEMPVFHYENYNISGFLYKSTSILFEKNVKSLSTGLVYPAYVINNQNENLVGYSSEGMLIYKNIERTDDDVDCPTESIVENRIPNQHTLYKLLSCDISTELKKIEYVSFEDYIPQEVSILWEDEIKTPPNLYGSDKKLDKQSVVTADDQKIDVFYPEEIKIKLIDSKSGDAQGQLLRYTILGLTSTLVAFFSI
ncbi:MAG: hypothetical protein KJ771_09040, partial [Nanoarchaeota archaeon]|nr:hypothetical protein [Nanoarchaeota archaeon]